MARSEVTPTGSASDTQRISTTTKIAAMRCPATGRASGVGSSSRSPAASTAATTPPFADADDVGADAALMFIDSM